MAVTYLPWGKSAVHSTANCQKVDVDCKYWRNTRLRGVGPTSPESHEHVDPGEEAWDEEVWPLGAMVGGDCND